MTDIREIAAGAVARHDPADPFDERREAIAGEQRELRTVPEGDELDYLLRSVERMAAGVADIREVVVKLGAPPVGPFPRRAWPIDVQAIKLARVAYIDAANAKQETVTLSRATVLGLLYAAGATEPLP